MSEASPQADLTPEQEAVLDAQANKLGSYHLARVDLGLAPVRTSSPGQIAHSARLQARAEAHAETVNRGQMDPAVELARVLKAARERQQPQTLDDELFGDY